MESIIPVLGVIFFLVYFANKLNKKDSDDNNISTDTIRSHDETIISMHESAHESAEQAYQHMENQKEQNQPDTLDLMFKTLNNLGCQPTKNDDVLNFYYMLQNLWDGVFSSFPFVLH